MTEPDDVTRANVARFSEPSEVEAWSRDSGFYPTETLLVDRWLPAPPATVLDLGCGTGRTSTDLVARGYQVTALDLNEDLLRIAKDRVPRASTVLMDASRLGMPDESFAAAFFSFNGIDCLFPDEQRTAVLAEAHRVLQPGGVLLLSSHCMPGHLGRDVRLGRRGLRKNARLLWHQRGNRHLRDGYWVVSEGDGTLLLYGASPKRTIRALHSAGFDVRGVVGQDGGRFRSSGVVHLENDESGAGFGPPVDLRTLTWRAPHIHYVASR